MTHLPNIWIVGFVVESDAVGAGLRKRFNEVHGLLHHEMAVEEHVLEVL